jgi:mono/diheme cytochrome c family protein
MGGRKILVVWATLGIATVHARTPGFDALQHLVESKGIGSVEALVAALPADLRTHYTLAFSSRSLQTASFEYPRVILYGTDASLVVTFNGESTQRGYGAVETMEFDQSTNAFIFREIAFAPSGDPSANIISGPNPARCVACHGAPARPIWDAPPTWPGIYGERYGGGLTSVEASGIRAFLQLQPTHARYRYLVDAARFANRSTYVPSTQLTYNGATVESPNARLSALLASFNVRSILSELMAQPGFGAHRYALLAAAGANCGAPARFYPEKAQAAIQSDYESFQRLTRTADKREAESKILRRASRDQAVRWAGETLELEALRFVSERSLGLSTGHWTLALERATYDFSAPESALTLAAALFEIVAGQDGALRDLAAYRDFSNHDGYCDHLRQESRRTLAAWYAEHPLGAPAWAAPDQASAAMHPGSIESCVSCHSSGAAPRLPFSDPAALAKQLAGDDRYPHGRLLDEILFRLTPEAGADRMPRGMNPTPSEQRELETYFLSLASPQSRLASQQSRR